jgi:antitoxin component HigA of HigAB toxin-antitoxin module
MPAACCVERWERLMREDPEQPVLTLLGQDVLAIETAEYWIKRARDLGVNPSKIAKVEEHIEAFRKYRAQHPERVKIPD